MYGRTLATIQLLLVEQEIKILCENERLCKCLWYDHITSTADR